ncbi:hypothetical protein BC941DRAFT_232437 [Chlamydoabsidia padenii]|nr:hypothetical protein BC941DRAFT_232437 [Chlamydoabsidia padenii]
MDFLKHHNDTTDWEELQEPVPFEDFKFSFGLDPDFSIPLPLGPNLTTTATPFNMSANASSDPMLSDEIFALDTYLSTNNSNNNPIISSVLDEQDQKTFSNFLDTFFMDQLPTVFDTSTNNNNESLQFMSPLRMNDNVVDDDDDDVEEQRRNSILQSLDHQKQKLHERLNFLASSTINNSNPDRRLNTTTNTNKNTSSKKSKHDHHHHHKELLTEEEKRANHIASEQKRRSTIRTGFKDLTEIIPTLKNINNSKSTILFKAVDFIKYLDRRNKSKREKIHQLELRLQLQGKMLLSPRRSLPSLSNHTSPASSSSSPPSSLILPCSFPPNVSAALLAHKSQQEQLLQLQEQLQLHQRLLARQQLEKEKQLPPFTLAPLKRKGFRAVRSDEKEDLSFHRSSSSLSAFTQ